MSTAGLSSTTRKFTLSFYFWLPAGRDEFELSRGDDQPFKDTANYRDKIESAVAKNLMIKINELSEKSSESFWLNNSSDLKVQDSNLGLRSLAFEFRYEPKRDENEDKSKTYNLPNQMARALILSNGLYLWQFDVEYRSDLSEQDISKSAGEFLRDHFVKEHISKLFNFEWTEKIKLVASPKDKKAYSGALTYYQIDLLFNGIFDKDAHPDNFIEPHSGSKSSDRIEGNDEHNYNVQGIIQSLSRFAINNHHYPLFVDFDKIPPTGAFENTFMEPISTDTDLFGTAPNTEADRFLSRISHAGMEQFLKAAISFGVIHYKAGLDHCRAQLTNASLLIRIHKTAGELLRPSLSPDLSSADLQAYTSIVAGKLPAFCFLYSLIEGIAQATRPFEARKDSRLGELEWDEWVHSQFTLHNALLYYHLYIESIKNDVTEINRSLETGRTDEIIAELTDTRKLTEIASESAHKTIYERNRKQLDQLMVRLTRFALLFSIVQVYAGFGVWWMDRLLPEQKETVSLKSSSWDLWHALLAIGQWPVVALTVILVYKVWVKQPLHETANIMKGQRLRDMPRRLHRKPRQPREMANGSKVQQPKDERSDENSDESNETHVFDYSFFHEKLPDGSTKMIDDLAEHMPNIERGGDVSRCASQSSSRETPLSGVERIKYTLESRNSPEEKGGYVFYLEVDRRMKSDKEYLRAVRLVIRKPAGTQCAAKECAWHIICECINKLFGDDQNKNKVEDTLKEHFWGVPDTTNQTADENPVNGELDPPAAELDDQESRVGAKPDSQLVVRADPGGPRPDDHTTVDETHQR